MSPRDSRGLTALVAVARGDEPPDLVITGARVFSVFTREWLELDVAVCDGRIAGLGSYDGGERVDAGGRWLVPGFIDAHVHIESSKLTPAEFVTHRFTFEQLLDAYDVFARAGETGALKVAVRREA